jgi:short-subunit dehydrogenase
VTVRVPLSMQAALRDESSQRGLSVSELVISAIEREFLADSSSEKNARSTQEPQDEQDQVIEEVFEF